MIKIKICGITTKHDALKLNSLGIDYMGMIFYSKSKRYIPLEKAKLISRSLQSRNSKIKTVGVFVNESLDVVKRYIQEAHLDLVQLHGDETLEFCKKLHYPIIKVFRIKSTLDLKEIKKFQEYVSYILLDTHHDTMFGGTGQTFSWNILNTKELKNIPFFLSGGLTSDNFSSALAYQPYALDFNSGVELSPGLKDIEKIKKIMHELKGR